MALEDIIINLTVGHCCEGLSECHIQASAIGGGIAFTYPRTALPLLPVTSQVSGCLQRDSSAARACKRSQVFMCFSSYTTQPGIKLFTLHLRAGLLLKTRLVLYSEKSVTGEQGLCSCRSPVNALGYLQSLLDALPSDNMERATSHPQFYVLWHAKANGSVGAYKLGQDAFLLFLTK